MTDYIFFVLSFVCLAVALGVAKVKEPYIALDESWKYINKINLQEILCYFDKEKKKSNAYIFYDLDYSYDIAFAAERFRISKKQYDDNHSEGNGLSSYFGYISISVIYLFNCSSWVDILCVPVAIILAIIAYVLVVKFANKESLNSLVYVEYKWNDNGDEPYSPEDFESCREYLKNEKDRCFERLNLRSDAYEHALYFEKYHIKMFRWASMFFTLALYLFTSNIL